MAGANSPQNFEEELLQFALDNDIMDLSSVQDAINMRRQKQELLAMHPFQIWNGKDGKWYTYLPDKEKGRVLKKRNSKDEIEKVVCNFWKEQTANPTIRELFEEWNDRRLELKKISPATHLRNKQFFNRHYKEMGERKIRAVSYDDWCDFLEAQIPKYNLTAKAFSGLKCVTKGLLKRAKKKKLIDFRVEDLFNDIDVSEAEFKKTIKEDYQEVFSEEETPIIMDYLEKNDDVVNSVLLLMFVSGMRAGEAVALKNSDIDSNTVNIRRTETRYEDDVGTFKYGIKEFPKTSAGVRTIVIPEEYTWLLKHIRTFNPFGEFIFVRQGERINTQTVRRRLNKVCKKLDIYPKSPHKIRKTYGTILLDNGVDQRLVIDQMGHTNILCTENHYHRNRRSVEKKSEILSALPDFAQG